MRVNIYSCLIVFVLGCNVTAAIKHETVEEKQLVVLRCPDYVEGDVTWSRETNGHRVDILTAGVNWDKKHIPDPGKRYSSQADKSLYIRRVNMSDSGRYLCNNAAAVELTVIPLGTTRLVATQWTTVTLNCPHDAGRSGVPTWSKDGREVQQNQRVYVSPVSKTLTITFVLPRDSGLYYCDGKPAVYLTVIKGDTSDRGKKTTTPPTTTTKPTTKPTTTTKPTMKPTTTKKPTKKTTTTMKPTTMKLTTTTSPSSSTAAPHLWQTVRLVIGGLYLIIMISITATAWTEARQEQKRRVTQRENDV